MLERYGAYHKGLRDFLDAFARNRVAARKSRRSKVGEDGEEVDLG